MSASSRNEEKRLVLSERRGLVRIELAMPLIDAAALDELETALGRIEDAAGRGDLRGLIMTGGDSGWPGGPAPSFVLDAPDAETVAAFAARGNEIARRIERLPVPVVALLQGDCLDAGLELALAAHVRIGCSGRGLRVGMPGLDAALPPLFGGLTRLVECAGLRRALDLLLERRRLGAAAALTAGLVAELAPAALLDERAATRVDEQLATWRAGQESRPSRRRIGVGDYLIDEVGFFRRLEIGRYRRRLPQVERPAALAGPLLDGIEGRFALPRFERLERESLAAAALAASPAALHRLSLLRRGDDLIRGGPYAPAGAEVSLPRRVAVLGAGRVGRHLALGLLGRGLRVSLFDPFARALVEARNHIDDALEDLVERGRLQASAAGRVRDRLLIEPEPRDLRDIDLVIECVPEVLALKQEVLRRAVELGGDRPVLVSHTIGLAPDELRRGLPAGRRVQVMHLLLPEEGNGLCEIVRARDAVHGELAMLARLARELGRFPLVSSGTAPGAGNRLLCSFFAEALRLFAEGFSARTIDRAARDFGFREGPLELLDRVGLDLVLTMARRFEEIAADGFRTPDALAALVERDEIGRRRGLGIRVWGRRGPEPRNESELRRICGLPAVMMEQDPQPIARRLLEALAFEGRRLVDRSLLDDPSELDLLSVHGIGFPAELGGLATWMDEEKR